MSKAASKIRDRGSHVMPTIRVPSSLHRQAKREAARQGRSLSNYVVTLMAQNVARQRRRQMAATAD